MTPDERKALRRRHDGLYGQGSPSDDVHRCLNALEIAEKRIEELATHVFDQQGRISELEAELKR